MTLFKTSWRRALAAVTVGMAAVMAGQRVPGTAAESAGLELTALSTRPELVTGGDLLVQIRVSPASAAGLRVTAAGRDVTAAFKPGSSPGTLVGLVSGLPLGDSTIAASAGAASNTLRVTNYPITGPVISGPWQQPFICQTEAFELPDGGKLGPAIDGNCSAKTVVQYIYLSKDYVPPAAAAPVAAADDDDDAAADPDARAARAAATRLRERGWIKPLPSLTSLPPDVAKTTTMDGKTVNFIVRVETGTMNRGIYQNAVLHDPTVDPPPSPATPPPAWNRRLVAMHGSGCPGGWYIQGAAQGANILDRTRLGAGYALFINTLNHPTNSCNAFLAGETTMMGKEHFIETFGVPLYTISTGGSGGAYTSLQVADAFPGLIDGVDIRATFPEALAIATSGLDARLLMHYFLETNPSGFTEAQKVAVSGYQGMKAFLDAANQSQRTDPVPDRKDAQGYQSARYNDVVPAFLRYDPVSHTGPRATVFDAAKNIYGINPRTGAALRTFDNTGVQYGLDALKSGVITMAQFLDLNARIGGVDDDANYTAARARGDAGAIRRAYQAGLVLSGGGGLASIPIIDNATSRETARYHYGWYHFATRERLRQVNGNSDNFMMWRSVSGTEAQKLFDQWMLAYKTDSSAASQREKVLKARPAAAVDGCFDKSTPPQFLRDSLPFTAKPESPCSRLYPVYSNPRKEAGGPLTASVLKCQTKPVNAGDYPGTVSPADRARLSEVFPEGVCDWSRPGVSQTALVPWASFGPSPKNLVFDVLTAGDGSR